MSKRFVQKSMLYSNKKGISQFSPCTIIFECGPSLPTLHDTNSLYFTYDRTMTSITHIRKCNNHNENKSSIVRSATSGVTTLNFTFPSMKTLVSKF